ncbi:MAG TPA: hypothetical protein VN426_01175 [Syntrophomonadaceae bacterium]|nr:hypothetical protein [Syntrophomonadaceae bacterium]
MRKADEMEIYISLKSMRFAWAYTIIFLLVWICYDYMKGNILGLPFILLTSQGIVFWSSQFIIRRIMAGKNEE